MVLWKDGEDGKRASSVFTGRLFDGLRFLTRMVYRTSDHSSIYSIGAIIVFVMLKDVGVWDEITARLSVKSSTLQYPEEPLRNFQ